MICYYLVPQPNLLSVVVYLGGIIGIIIIVICLGGIIEIELRNKIVQNLILQSLIKWRNAQHPLTMRFNNAISYGLHQEIDKDINLIIVTL